MTLLFAFLNSIAPMSKELQDYLEKLLKPIKFKKNEITLRPGQICKMICFLESGVVRQYILSGSEKKVTWIHISGAIFISIESFYFQTPTDEFIQATMPCNGLYITYEELQTTLELFPEFNKHYRAIGNKYQAFQDKFRQMLAELDPIDRIKWLQKNHPEVCARAPINSIWSYLNMTRNTYYDCMDKLAGKK